MKTTTTSRREWLIPASLVLLSLVPAIAGTARLAELGGDGPMTASNARFFDQPIPIVLHILAVVPYSIVGAFQFAPGFRKRNRPWHRAAGRVIGMLGLLSALTGLWMAHFYPWPAGDGMGVYVERLIAGFGMLAFIMLGLNEVRRRNFKVHGEWMIRAYALGLGAGTQVLTHMPYFMLVDTHPGETGRTVMMGLGWLINAIVAEWIIRSKRPRAGVAPVLSAAA